MHIRVGDHVRILNEPVEGKVTEIISEKEVYVHTTEGFDFKFPANELIKVDSEQDAVEFEIDSASLAKRVELKKSKGKSHQDKGRNPEMKQYLEHNMVKDKRGDTVVEIDLHLEELVPHPGKLNNWQKIYIQLEHFQNCLEEAMRLKISNLVFIHGVGEGRLREEIRQLLHSYPNVEYSDAEYDRYGAGATKVTIRGLFAD